MFDHKTLKTQELNAIGETCQFDQPFQSGKALAANSHLEVFDSKKQRRKIRTGCATNQVETIG